MEKLYIKNMVCDRCIISVTEIFHKNGITPLNVKLGVVEVKRKILHEELIKISEDLQDKGFKLIDNSTTILVTKIKAALVTLFNQNELQEGFKLSNFIKEKFPYDYSHLSRLFSSYEKDTIEHFFINLRIEKAKELLSYNDISVSEVAYKLGYASAAHFSRQFKKIVGVSPSIFKNNPSNRKPLDDI